MSSDGSIRVNNSLSTFELRGVNSNLQNDELIIYGEYISGVFSGAYATHHFTSNKIGYLVKQIVLDDR